LTTLLQATPGSLILRGLDGGIRFWSEEKLFQATERVSGSIAVGPWSGTATWPATRVNVNQDINHFLKTIDPSCDTVVGAFSVTSSYSGGVSNLGWFNASGTYLHYSNNIGGGGYGMVLFTFLASGGSLLLNERAYVTATFPGGSGTLTHTVLALTIQYNLYVGSFV
jgi:hypothetical protein